MLNGTLRQEQRAWPGQQAIILALHSCPWLFASLGFWLGQQGPHIITPCKKQGAGPLERYQQLRQLQRGDGRHFMYEVGGSMSTNGTAAQSVKR
jgi:hypothetical protein